MNKKTDFLFLLLGTLLVLIFSTCIFSQKGLESEEVKDLKSSAKSRFNLRPLEKEVKVVIGGDVMLGRSVLTKADKLGDYSYSFGNISKIFKPADIVFVNLESPFYENCPRSNTGLKFCTDFKMADELVKGGVNVVTLANNHITNYGQEGLTQTQTLLDQKGIAWCGFGQLAQKEVEGVKFGFLGFNFTSQGLSPFDLTQIKEADNLVDILIVGVHWGEEYKTTPSENQKKWAEQIIKAGGDIIAGHHPHWVQEMEYINGKPIYFSLGNLIFDQLWSEKTKFVEVVELSFWKKKLTNQKTYKIYMGQLGLPEIVE